MFLLKLTTNKFALVNGQKCDETHDTWEYVHFQNVCFLLRPVPSLKVCCKRPVNSFVPFQEGGVPNVYSRKFPLQANGTFQPLIPTVGSRLPFSSASWHRWARKHDTWGRRTQTVASRLRESLHRRGQQA